MGLRAVLSCHELNVCEAARPLIFSDGDSDVPDRGVGSEELFHGVLVGLEGKVAHEEGGDSVASLVGLVAACCLTGEFDPDLLAVEGLLVSATEGSRGLLMRLVLHEGLAFSLE